MKKTLAEEIFGGASAFQGWGSGGDDRGETSKEARKRASTPRYHEGEQVDSATVEPDNRPITEGELCSHF